MMLDRGKFRLHYRVDGTPGAPWITYSNSLVCTLSMWNEQVSQMAERYRILRYDTRGHGGSEAAPAPYSIGQLADDVIALWDHLGIERSHFVGLSLGGMTGIALALDHPGRLLSLTAADCRATADQRYAEMFRGRIETRQNNGIAALVQPTLERFFTKEFAADHPDIISRYATMIRATSDEGHDGCCAALSNGDYFTHLGDIVVPTLFVGGRHDIGAPPDLMGAMSSALPGSRHVVLEEAGHISCEEDPRGFAAAVLANIETMRSRHSPAKITHERNVK